MDRFEAIKRLETLVEVWDGEPFIKESVEAYKVAIAAIREQEQREHGCEWCWHFSNDPQHLLSLGNGMYTEIIYKFCPNCGAKMDLAI